MAQDQMTLTPQTGNPQPSLIPMGQDQQNRQQQPLRQPTPQLRQTLQQASKPLDLQTEIPKNNLNKTSLKQSKIPSSHESDPYSEWEKAVQNQNTHIHATANQDRLSARIKLVTNRETSKNPLKFTDPTDRMAATLAKAQRIVHSDWYQKLPDKYKDYVKSAYYEAYVRPVYQSGKFDLPNKNLWMREIEKTDQDPRQYYEPLGWRNFDHFAYSTVGALGNVFNGMSRGGIWVGKQIALSNLKLDHFFSLNPAHKMQDEIDEKYILPIMEANQQQEVDKISNHVFDNVNFWLQTNPNRSLSDKVGSLTGEVLVQLPLYAGIDEGLGVVKVGSGLTKILEATAKGKFISSRLTEAASGYLGSLLQNGTPEENRNAALLFMGFGTAASGIGKTLTAGSSMLAKKFTANILSLGGRPFQQVLTDQAIQEMGQVANHVPDEIITPQLLQKIREEDSLKFDLLSAEKGVLNSLSLVQFGKTFGKLDDAEKVAVRIARKNQVEQTISELPIHVPDIAQSNIEQSLASQRKSNPQLDATINYLEQKYGGRVSDELKEAEATDIKEQSGISNIQSATKNVGNEVTKINKEDEEALSKASEIEPKQFAELGQTSLDYFENSLRMKGATGGFDYEDWLSGMSDKDFDSEVREHLGNQPFFENPHHLMLWAYQYRDKMPTPFKNRIVQRLEDLDPTGTPKSWANESRNMERHLEKLADTGKLFTEGNVYRSSKFDSWGTRTKWQRELNNKDLEKAENLNLQKALKPYVNSFPQQVKTAQVTLKNLQLLRRKAADANEDFSITSTIKTFKSDVSKLLRKIEKEAE